MEMEIAIRVIAKIVLSQHTVLNNLSIDVREGEFITIVGPSGCGKSTLLNIVSGIDTSYKGDIQIDGKPISQSINTDRIVIFQEGALFPWLTVYENVIWIEGRKTTKRQKKGNSDALYSTCPINKFCKCLFSSVIWRYETESSNR